MLLGSTLACPGTPLEVALEFAGNRVDAKEQGSLSSSEPQAANIVAVVAAVEELRMAAVVAAPDMRMPVVAWATALVRSDSKLHMVSAAGFAWDAASMPE